MKLHGKRFVLQLAALSLMAAYLFCFSLSASAKEYGAMEPHVLSNSPIQYSPDISADTQENTSFRRIDLEEAPGLDRAAAGKIRAIVLHSYPQKNVVAIQARANSWLRGQGLPEIVDLRSGEAIRAAQLAVWELTGADPYLGGGEDLEETENTTQNMESLRAYLSSLDGVEPKYDTVSDASLENATYSAAGEEDGTYTVTVTVTVNTTVGPKDALTIRAVCADQEQSEQIANAGKFSFSFNGLSALEEVQLEISGDQCGGDVYLFDREGEQEALVGYDDRMLPVFGAVTVNTDRILNIRVSAEKQPLANIRFDIYQVASAQQLESGEVTLSEAPTQADIAKYMISANLIAAVTTDSQGTASCNFTQKGHPDGVYLVAERFSSATAGAVSPFYITLPSELEAGGYSCSLNLDLRNDTEPGPEIRKEVMKIDERGTFAPGQYHTWRICGSVPAGVGTARRYVIAELLDSRLSYEEGSPVVKLYTRADTEMRLEEGAHYTLTEDNGRGTADRFQISLTPAGMAYVAANLGEGEKAPEIRVSFNAAIREDADLSTQLSDAAHLEYTNSAGVEYRADLKGAKPETDDAITIISTDPLLPGTGELDTSAFTVTGIGILGAASALLFANRKGSV